MGRIKTKLIKRTGEKILKIHKDMLTKDFDKNKKVLDRVASIPSKKLRNTIAGYIVKTVKKREKDIVLD
ncbi:MAG: 30S ribosomal protein S17e [Candidatus Nanoarchaeia archaeon]|nr:30S ribosomal protein S17e [Candidatus Nanoarchaeia archaeon]